MTGAADEHDQGSERDRAQRVEADVSRWVGQAVGRAREGAEDIWAEAQELRHEDRSVVRRGVAYGLAGVIRASERVKAIARGAAAGARAGSETTQADSEATERRPPSEHPLESGTSPRERGPGA
jgi:hypothetical protein